MTDSLTIKSTGATFTPDALAAFIASTLLGFLSKKPDRGTLKILDPSCGDGSLLEAVRFAASNLGIDVELYGYDINPEYLDQARENINGPVQLVHQDFLLKEEADLFSTGDNVGIDTFFDVIIANPPYVRTQILGAEYSKQLARQYQLKGKVDLYHAFIIRMTQCLKVDGIIGFITSNKFISNKSGVQLRHFLTRNYQVFELYDLGDTKLFSAAVLPAIVFARKSNGHQNKSACFVKIYQSFDEEQQVEVLYTESKYNIIRSDTDGYYGHNGEVFQRTSGRLKFNDNKDCNWSLLTESEAAWIDRIEARAHTTVKDVLKVRVGIKSTADKVFIRENWDNLGFPVEEEMLVDLISQENIDAYRLRDGKSLRVIYPYKLDAPKKEVYDLAGFPGAARYFEQHAQTLRARKYLIDGGRNWYELWVPQNPTLWKQPKLVFPDISDRPRFYLDFSGRIVNGNCYWITAANDQQLDYLYLLQAVANSAIMTRYHDLVFMNKLYSGRRRYMTQYVERYPLPDISSKTARKIIKLSKAISKEPGKIEGYSFKIEVLLERFYIND